MKLGLGLGVLRTQKPNIVINVVTPPTFDTPLEVGDSVSAAYNPGSYTSPSGTVTEYAVASYVVNGFSVDDGYTILPGDQEIYAVALLAVNGSPISVTQTTAVYPVTYPAPTVGSISGTFDTTTGSGSWTPSVPTLSSPTGANTGANTADIGATTDTGSGHLYAVVTLSSATTPDGTEILAETDGDGAAPVWSGLVAVSSTGAKTLSVTGLSSGPTYKAHLVQVDADGEMSNVVSSSTFSTAAITFLGYTSASGTGATYDIDNTSLNTTTGGAGGALQQNDIGIVVVTTAVTAGDADLSVSGWTEIDDLYATDTRSINLYVGYKFMGASPDTTTTVPGPNNTGHGGCSMIFWFRYVNTTTPLDVTYSSGSHSNTVTNTALFNPPSITPVSTGAKILALGGGTGDTTPATYTQPSGMTLLGRITHGGSARGARLVGAIYDWTSGAYDPAAVTNSEDSTNDSGAGLVIALKPA